MALGLVVGVGTVTHCINHALLRLEGSVKENKAE